MDIAYDHIQEETLSPDTPRDPTDPSSAKPQATSLNIEFQETFRAFSASPWGARLGGFLGTVRKQGESYYEGARQEYTAASEEALKGFTDLKESIVNRTRGLSLGEKPEETKEDGEDAEAVGESEDTNKARDSKPRTASDETLKGNDGLISRFRSEAAKRLKDIEKAEDAADEALLRFGANIRNFLRDAVTIAPPPEDATDSQRGGVLFESKDSEGKRVIHTTRFDAQLHVIHSSLDSFMKDPVSTEWPEFKREFKADEKTEEIGKDLEKYAELRRAMERLVPEKVEYGDFWCRYYFLRLVIETEEQKRRELLKGMCESIHRLYAITNRTGMTGASTADEEVAWDEDSDTEETPSTATPQVQAPSSSTWTTQPTTSQSTHKSSSSDPSLKPAEPRRSNDQHSQPDSDASYDLVSGATSRAPGSPKEEKASQGTGVEKTVQEESDEDDWE